MILGWFIAMHDVYAYGVIAASTLVELEGGFPPEAGYAEVSEVHHSLGGEAAAGAHVLANLGVATKLAGTHLGTDESADWVVDRLSRVGVDCSRIVRVPGGGVTEIVVSSGSERTVFASYGRMLEDRAWGAPERSDVQASRMVCLDPFFSDDSEQVASWCLADGIPYVTVDVVPESLMARGASAVVVSEEFAVHQMDETDLDALLALYVEHCSGLVILTQGAGVVRYQRRNSEPRTFPAFDVDVVDTTGAGDAFRAGVIWAFLDGSDDDQTVRAASAVAALVCQTSPGVINSPTEEELLAFLATR